MARYILGDLVWRVTGETRDFDRDIRRTDQRMGRFGKTSGATTATLAKFAGGALAAAAVLRGVARASAQAARDASAAEETYAKFGTVFEDVAGEAERAADNLAESFGLAGSTARALLGDTGDLLTGLGLTADAALDLSVQTNELAVDLASFTNAAGGAEAVSRALTSAYTGEREALKTYGIVINEALVEQELLRQEQEGLTFATEQQAKAFATLTIAQRQSVNAIGDYARTSESAANVQRRLEQATLELRENYGELVLEGLTPFRRALIRLTSNLNENLESMNNLRNILGELEETGETTASLDEVTSALERVQKEIRRLELSGMGIAADRVAQLREEEAALLAVAEELDYLRSLELRYGEAGRQAADERAAALLREQQAAAEAAERNRVALEKRIELREEYSQRILELEGSTFDQIEARREAALADAAESYVRSGEEIEQINRYYDALREEEEQRIAEADRQRLEDLAAFQREVIEERREREAETLQAIQEEYERTADAIFGYLAPTFEALGEALSGVEDGWVSLGKTAVKSIATIIKAIARELAIRSAAAFALLQFGRGARLAAASAAALVASGVVSGLADQIGSAANGADFTTNGPQLLLVGDNPGGRERVTVEPLSSPNTNGPGGDVHVQINLDGDVISKFVTKSTRSGRILVDQRSVV